MSDCQEEFAFVADLQMYSNSPTADEPDSPPVEPAGSPWATEGESDADSLDGV